MIAWLGALIAGGLSAAAPLSLAALGGLVTARAGSLTVALEGSMVAGAFAAAAVAKAAAEAGATTLAATALALCAAVAAGALLSFLVGAAAEWLGAEVFVAGLAANLLSPGVASMASQALYGTKGVLTAEALRAIPVSASLSSSLPLLGRALFGQGLAFYLVLLASVALALLLDASVFGLRASAAGEDPEVSRAAGIDPRAYRIGAHLLAGGASGLAGAFLVGQVAAFVPGISAGRGWIALVAVYLGGRDVRGVLLSCLGFGLLISASNALQGGSAGHTGAALLAGMPYLATAVALVAWRRAGRRSGGR